MLELMFTFFVIGSLVMLALAVTAPTEEETVIDSDVLATRMALLLTSDEDKAVYYDPIDNLEEPRTVDLQFMEHKSGWDDYRILQEVGAEYFSIMLDNDVYCNQRIRMN